MIIVLGMFLRYRLVVLVWDSRRNVIETRLIFFLNGMAEGSRKNQSTFAYSTPNCLVSVFVSRGEFLGPGDLQLGYLFGLLDFDAMLDLVPKSQMEGVMYFFQNRTQNTSSSDISHCAVV